MTWFKRALPAVALALLLSSSSAHAQVVSRPSRSRPARAAPLDTRAYRRTASADRARSDGGRPTGLTLELGSLYVPTSADTLPEPNVAPALALHGRALQPAPGGEQGRSIRDHRIRLRLEHGRRRHPDKLGRGTPRPRRGRPVQPVRESAQYARVQVRDVMFKERNAFEYSHDFAATLGFQYIFGGKYKDQDLDEVRDWIDNCPATPIGATVNTGGCPSDADRDSVVDGVDKCPDTPFRAARSTPRAARSTRTATACATASTNAPDTPKGAHVDALGCPHRRRPRQRATTVSTSARTRRTSCTVDANGCPIDTDGDGVCDALDKCPNTPTTAQGRRQRLRDGGREHRDRAARHWPLPHREREFRDRQGDALAGGLPDPRRCRAPC